MTTTISTETVDVAALREMLAQARPLTILDVRPEEEWAEWRIPGSRHVDAYAALKSGDPDALAGVDLPGDKPVITICGAGVTSLTAARQLRERGYQACSLAGGMKAWSLAWNSADVPLPASQARVVQLRRTGKGCLSYLIGSGDEALVIDASLPPPVYTALATQHGWRITQVVDTHIHADHLSRSRLLAGMTGATLYLPQNERAADFTPLQDGEVLAVGDGRLQLLATPGHTEESAVYLLDEQALFTGDTLFLDGVGRPDLEANFEEAARRARTLYRSLQRLQQLPGDLLILPGHTNEPVPFDGAPLAVTLQEVRAQVSRLRLAETEFVNWLLAHLPPTPPNHSRIVALNEAGSWPEGDVTDLEAGANRCAVG
jgi:glyoxylase-like metal-dependent hydrolase (beta-lactamase superfamily II)/rhodanese-related sulfurtransferase